MFIRKLKYFKLKIKYIKRESFIKTRSFSIKSKIKKFSQGCHSFLQNFFKVFNSTNFLCQIENIENKTIQMLNLTQASCQLKQAGVRVSPRS